jgi:hypothetical protein
LRVSIVRTLLIRPPITTSATFFHPRQAGGVAGRIGIDLLGRICISGVAGHIKAQDFLFIPSICVSGPWRHIGQGLDIGIVITKPPAQKKFICPRCVSTCIDGPRLHGFFESGHHLSAAAPRLFNAPALLMGLPLPVCSRPVNPHFSQKWNRLLNRPAFWRAAIDLFNALAPTPLTAASPKSDHTAGGGTYVPFLYLGKYPQNFH